MLSQFRSVVTPIKEILAYPFVALRIHPDYVSLLGLLCGIAGAFFLFELNWSMALLFFILAPLCDMIDGTVAKKLNLTSPWGNYFETMIDKFVDVCLLAPFVFLFPLASVLALGFSMIASYAKPRVGLIIITDNRDWPAIGEHADKMIIMLVALAFAAVGVTAIGSFQILELALLLVAAVSLIGALQRMYYARTLIKEATKNRTLLPYLQKKEIKKRR